MSALLRFEDPFRPLVEIWAVSAWVVAAIGTLVATYLMPYPSTLFVYFAAGCMAMAVWRAVPAVRLARVQKGLGGTDILFMAPQDLHQVPKVHEAELFLGFGYDWTQQETQIAHTLARHDPDRLLPRKEGSMGQAWIHGIGALRERPLFIPIEHTGTHTLIVGTTGSFKTRFP